MKKIICLENLPYNSHIQVGSHHYARLFSKEFDVLWISLPWHLPQLMMHPHNERFASWRCGNPEIVSKTLRSLVPFTFLPYRNNPFFNSDFIVNNYYSLMLPNIKKMLHKLAFEDVELLWFTDPRHISILKHLNYNKLAYRCVDNLEQFSDVPSGLLEIEKQLIKRCDAVFYTSKELCKKFLGLNDNGIYLSNGVDYDFFNSSPSEKDMEEISKFVPICQKQKRVIYIGAIAEWFDFSVLQLLASRFHDYSFLIVGPQRVRVPAEIKKMSNVTFAGPIAYRLLPGLLRHFSIGLIPFKVNKMTNCVSPIKLFEYFSAGLAVVSSKMDTVKGMESPAMLYNSENIVDVFEEAISLSGNEVSRNLHKEYAQSNSWPQRFKQIKSQLGLRS